MQNQTLKFIWMIIIEDLNVSYERGKSVLKDLSLSLPEDNIHGVVGLNGSGKTTLLNTMFGLKKQDSGTIMYGDNVLNKKDIAYLVTDNYFYPNITGNEYLGLFKNVNFDTEKWNKVFKLPLDELIENYSSGMKKKLAILGTLKQDKPILILDEPFNGLDIETVRVLREILLKLKENGKTIIITSHILETLTNLCDYIHYLEGGIILNSKDKSGFKSFEKEIFNTIKARNREIIDELKI